MANPYALPDLIMIRLSTLEWPVLHVADLNRALEETQLSPALLVIPYGVRVADDGDDASVRETVLITALVRSVNQRGGTQARQQSGELLTAAAALLRGWQPTTAYTPLDMETPPQPQFVNGVALYPLQFAANYSLE
jgi:hypothetical protein